MSTLYEEAFERVAREFGFVNMPLKSIEVKFYPDRITAYATVIRREGTPPWDVIQFQNFDITPKAKP